MIGMDMKGFSLRLLAVGIKPPEAFFIATKNNPNRGYFLVLIYPEFRIIAVQCLEQNFPQNFGCF